MHKTGPARPRTKIWDLFGSNSLLLLNLFSFDIENKSLLEKPDGNWNTDPEFIFMKNRSQKLDPHQ